MEIRPIFSALLRNKTGPILVALQVALSLAILSNAAYIINDRNSVTTRPSGLSDESSTFYISVRPLSDETPELRLDEIKRQTQILRAISGVVAVAQVNQMPMSRNGGTSGIALDPRQDKPSAEASVYRSGDSLVKTFGLDLVEGRDFQRQEITDVNETTENKYPQTVIISKSMAEKLWPGASAVGKIMYFGTGGDAHSVRVVGVVERLISAEAETGERGLQSIIVPQRLYGNIGTPFAIRTENAQRDRVMKEAEEAIRKSSVIPMIIEFSTVTQDREDRYLGDVELQWMLVVVSMLLLLITCCGIAGMASLWVTQRRKQIGVRRALGARRVDILRYFVMENLMITSAGIFTGIVLGLALNELLVSRLEMARLPIVYLIGCALGLLILGVLSTYGPARRAANISPASAAK